MQFPCKLPTNGVNFPHRLEVERERADPTTNSRIKRWKVMSDHKLFFKAEMTRIAMSQDKEVGVERGSMVGQVTKRILCLGTFFCQ